MKKRLLAALLAAAMTAALLAGCGGSGSSEKSTQSADANKTITVAASSTPHAEILEAARPYLEDEGYELKVSIYDDYILPNDVVESGEFDANYFQHVPYLDSFNKEKGTHLVDAGKIHYEPLGIYPGTKKSLDELAEGDTIAIPNDATNEARALLLLQKNGIITLNEGAGITATPRDIADNPKKIEFVEVDAAGVYNQLNSVAFGIINGNYALQHGLSAFKDALTYEAVDSEAAKTYVNIIAVKKGNETSDKITALVNVLKSDEIVNFITEKYEGNVIPYKQ